MHYSYQPDISELSLSTDLFLQEIGYGNIQASNEIKETINSIWNEIKCIVRPRCEFIIINGELDKNSVILSNGVVLNIKKILHSLLHDSERFVIFVATAGNEFQKYKDSASTTNDIIKTYIIDLIGTCIVEALGDYMEKQLETIINTRHTNRFSPGYCGWNLSEQKTIFKILGNKPCDIILSDVCLMIPEKSISGIIGIGENVDEKVYGCKYCNLKNCYKKKKHG